MISFHSSDGERNNHNQLRVMTMMIFENYLGAFTQYSHFSVLMEIYSQHYLQINQNQKVHVPEICESKGQQDS